MTVTAFPYVWAWSPKPSWSLMTVVDKQGGRRRVPSPPRVFDRDRKGERCRVVARGRMNSALVEFVDGYRVVTSRNGIRRAPAVLTVRRAQPEGFVVDEDDRHLLMLSRREVIALGAVAGGRVHWRWKRTHSPWWYDRRLEPVCDDFGIGYGTLYRLVEQWSHRRPNSRLRLIAPHTGDEGPAELTADGEAVLAALRDVEGMVFAT